jgi:hypothetical protein
MLCPYETIMGRMPMPQNKDKEGNREGCPYTTPIYSMGIMISFLRRKKSWNGGS